MDEQQRAQTPCLVALCPECRAIMMAACLGSERERREAAKEAADAALKGYIVETWDVEQVRGAPFDCEHAQAKRAERTWAAKLAREQQREFFASVTP